ncbi:MAG: hypothetical protein J6386_06945 [Candidatus Synoicihabitans palmerolidicus]|nr:hypothetical protein [Candidatus Synoicihabitans palmerolidicus]
MKSYRASSQLASDAVWSLAEGLNGDLWFYYYDQGLGLLRNGEISFFPAPSRVRPRLRGMEVDSRGRVWMSTWESGLWIWEAGEFSAVPLPE